MRGVRFCIPNEYAQFLWEILKFINFENYTWYSEQVEILYFNEMEGKACNDFFASDCLTGAEFKERITREDYYLSSVNIKAYPLNAKKESILTYDDFSKSQCEIIVLCTDSEYVDCYSKNEAFCEKVYTMCLQHGFQNVEYITEINDERTGLRV